MLLNERDIRLAELRRQDMRREARQERLAQASRLSRSERQSKRQQPLWVRVWLLF